MVYPEDSLRSTISFFYHLDFLFLLEYSHVATLRRDSHPSVMILFVVSALVGRLILHEKWDQRGRARGVPGVNSTVIRTYVTQRVARKNSRALIISRGLFVRHSTFHIIHSSVSL